MKKLIIALVAAACLCTSCTSREAIAHTDVSINNGYCREFYSDTEETFINSLKSQGKTNVIVYDSSELTMDILENRAGNTIVERCVGVVMNAERGDGIILNAQDNAYNYINYWNSGISLHKGDKLLSYLVYAPEGSDVDNIVERYDFPITEE